MSLDQYVPAMPLAPPTVLPVTAFANMGAAPMPETSTTIQVYLSFPSGNVVIRRIGDEGLLRTVTIPPRALATVIEALQGLEPSALAVEAVVDSYPLEVAS